jgi:hypothetical protein
VHRRRLHIEDLGTLLQSLLEKRNVHESRFEEVAASWKKPDHTFYAYWGSTPYEIPA